MGLSIHTDQASAKGVTKWSPHPSSRLRWRDTFLREVIMQDVTLIGIDLGKHSFHLHGQDRRGRMVFRKKVTRKQLIEFFASFHACTVVMEVCAGAHYMARKLAASGHEWRRSTKQ